MTEIAEIASELEASLVSIEYCRHVCARDGVCMPDRCRVIFLHNVHYEAFFNFLS